MSIAAFSRIDAETGSDDGSTVVSPVAEELCRQFPILASLEFSFSTVGRGQCVPMVVGCLLSALSREAEGPVCVVLPSGNGIAVTGASIASVHLLQIHFPDLIERFALEGFRRGERVRVVPTGHVYEYDGYFSGVRVEGSAPKKFFKLKVLGQNAWRSFPLEEILRIQPTELKRPKGQANTNLGSWASSTLDKLLGISSGGNLALFRNHVWLLAERSSTASFASSCFLFIKGCSSALFKERLSDLLTWGVVTPDGEIRGEGRLRGQDEPMIAVASSLDSLAAASERVERGSRLVLIDGAQRVRNLQAFDAVADRQRVVVVADQSSDDQLAGLRDRGCAIWWVDPDDAKATITGDPSTPDGPFRPFLTAASNYADLTFNVCRVEGGLIDDLSAALDDLDRLTESLPPEGEIPGILRSLYGLLLQSTEWCGPRTGQQTSAFPSGLELACNRLQAARLWMTEEQDAAFRRATEILSQMAQGDFNAPARKLDSLLGLLSEAENKRVAVLCRTPSGVLALRSLASPLIDRTTVLVPAELRGIGKRFDHLVAITWIRRQLFHAVVTQYAAPLISLIGYEVEEKWLAGYRAWRKRLYLDNRKTCDEKAAVTGLRSWPRDGEAARHEVPAPDDVDDVMARAFSWNPRERSGPISASVPSLERRAARYVRFRGSSHTFLTEGHKVPVVTSFVSDPTGSKSNVVYRSVEHLAPGDFLLFREQGERDIIVMIAEQVMGVDEYRRARATADSWRKPLRSTGATSDEIYDALRVQGLGKTKATVRNWLIDDQMIAPDHREDLEIIGAASGDADFLGRLGEIDEAIRLIRGVHIQAGSRLTQLLIAELPKAELAASQDDALRVDLTFGNGWIVQVDLISDDYEERHYLDVNHLIWEG
jgi:hypothetical protein